jgi:hypothetical protein
LNYLGSRPHMVRTGVSRTISRPQLQQLGMFGLTQAALARLAGRCPGPEVIDPPTQRLLLQAQLPSDRGHLTAVLITSFTA